MEVIEMEEMDVRLTKQEAEKGELVDEQGRLDVDKFLAKYKIPLGIGFVGVILIGLGALLFLKTLEPQEKIEIISGEIEESEKSIYCDIGGAVEKPGVYQLVSGSRVEDLLIASGGLSAEADREWMERSLNRAQKLVDGAKIYIPVAGQAINLPVQSGNTGQSSGGQTAGVATLININTAFASQLDTLWGIGPVRAQDIIDGRPYQAVEELKTKKIIPSNVYERIKDQVSVY